MQEWDSSQSNAECRHARLEIYKPRNTTQLNLFATVALLLKTIYHIAPECTMILLNDTEEK